MAFIRYSQPFNGHLAEVVSAEKARAIQEALDNPKDGLSDAQTAYLNNIAGVYHAKPTMMPKTAQKHSMRVIADENNKLFHEGREQGMYQAVPTGDQ